MADPHPQAFHTTRWSLVLQAGLQGDDTVDSHQALAELCQAYWYPLYGYVRRQGHAEPDAKDLVQGFFEHLLEREMVATADPSRGRFRSYLLGSLKHYLSDEQRRRQAIKRGGQAETVSIDTEAGERLLQAENTDERDPEKLYHRGWAESLLNQAIDRLREAHVQVGKQALFEHLEPHLVGNDKTSDTRQALANKLGMTAGAISSSLHRMRQRYGELVREAIADTVSDPNEVDEELRFLMSVLRERA